MTQRALPSQSDDDDRDHTVVPPCNAAAATPSWAEDVVAFINTGQEDVAKIDRPDPVPNLLEAVA